VVFTAKEIEGKGLSLFGVCKRKTRQMVYSLARNNIPQGRLKIQYFPSKNFFIFPSFFP